MLHVAHHTPTHARKHCIYQMNAMQTYIVVTTFCWGMLSSSQVHEIASLAKRDRLAGADMSELDRLEAIGSHGKHAGNYFRDILRMVSPMKLCAAFSVRIPVFHKLLGHGRPLFPFLLPHELFSSIYYKFPRAFAKVIAPVGEIARFWREVAGGI